MHTTNHQLLIEDSDGDVIEGHDTCTAHCCSYLADKLGVRNRDSVLMGYSGETEFNTICEVCNIVIHGTEGLDPHHDIKCSNYRCEVCYRYEWKTVSDLIDIIKASIHHSYLPNKENYTVAFDHTGGGCWAIAINEKDGSQYLIGVDSEPFILDDLHKPLDFGNDYEPAFGISEQYGPNETVNCGCCNHCFKMVWVNQTKDNGVVLTGEELEGAIITKLIGAIFDLLTDYQECEEQ